MKYLKKVYPDLVEIDAKIPKKAKSASNSEQILRKIINFDILGVKGRFKVKYTHIYVCRRKKANVFLYNLKNQLAKEYLQSVYRKKRLPMKGI